MWQLEGNQIKIIIIIIKSQLESNLMTISVFYHCD